MQDEIKDIDRAIEILEPIPNSEFCSGWFGIPETKQCCVLGHIERVDSGRLNEYENDNLRDDTYEQLSYRIRMISDDYMSYTTFSYWDIAGINNRAPDDCRKSWCIDFLKQVRKHLTKNSPEPRGTKQAT